MAEGEKRSCQVHVLVAPTCETVINLSKYSQLRTLLLVTGWIFRFIHKARKSLNDETPCVGLSADEVKNAELFWVRYTQQHSFTNEFHVLQQGQELSSTSSLRNLKPFLDRRSDVIRLGGRLQLSHLAEEQKHPIILPPEGHFVDLVIQDVHEKMLHASVRDVLVQLRERYWLIRGRQTVRRVIYKCVVCRRERVKPYTEQVAPLPTIRVTESKRPFVNIGIDYAGPVYVKDGGKCYILLMTCAATRAIHLEMTNSLNVKDFMLAFRRFIGRRGLCKQVISDNATTFKAASKLLAERHEIKWQFITERAPWHGGMWERLVRSVKQPLRRILGRTSLNFIGLMTVMCEIEAVINSRPITYVTDDQEEIEPLTPAHFIIGERLLSSPLQSNVEDNWSEDLRAVYAYRRKLLQDFWVRWSREYLSTLQPCQERRDGRTGAAIGDVVLIDSEQPNRYLWPIGIVTERFTGKDGHVRSVRVRSNRRYYTRPIQKLYHLESEKCEAKSLPRDESETVTRSGRNVRAPQRMDL